MFLLRSLEMAEKTKEKQKSSDIAIQVDSMLECSQVELQARLDDAEALVKRLRLESEDQRKEIANLKSAGSNGNVGGSRSATSSSSSSSRSGRGPQNPAFHRQQVNEAQHHHLQEQENYHKFPPLQTQSYWHHRPSRPNHR